MVGKSLIEIAKQLKDADKKVQLVYAFNGTGKTRLSREFKSLIAPKNNDNDEIALVRHKILYYNAFTEDLFYWNNGEIEDVESKLKIQPNSFTNWIFNEQGKEFDVSRRFQYYTSDKLTPNFNAEQGNVFSEVTFSFTRGDDSFDEKIRISKGEENNFIWSIFYCLIEQVIDVLNVSEPSERETNQFDQLEYIFVDDPVSSLDDNHLIQLAVDLASLITKSQSTVKFVVTTHNPLFYNILFNELKIKKGYIFRKQDDGLFELEEKQGDSNTSFSYHLFIKRLIEEAIENNSIQRYHFVLLRNLYEKTASFLGYQQWSKLLPNDGQDNYYNRIIQFTSHSTLSIDAIAEPSEPEKNTVKLLLTHLIENYHFWKQEQDNVN